MEKIEEYKQTFIETRVPNKVRNDLKNEPIIPLDGQIGVHIEDMEITIPDMARGIFDKLERPVIIVCDDNIEYVNAAFLKMLEITNPNKILNEKFLKFVSQDDWDFIAENIGDILTENGTLELRMLNADYKVIKMMFDTMYLEDKDHFCFMLMGRPVEVKVSANAIMYDDKIGLPRFSLFEDRVQNMIDYENYKSPALKRDKLVVCGVAIKNFTALKNDGQAEFIMQRLAEKLLLSLNKLYTIAVGGRYQFWLLLPDMQSDIEIEQEINNIQNLFNQPIIGKHIRHDISVAMGVSVYPDTAQSAKKMISQAELAIRQALKEKQSQVVYFGA